MIDLFPSRKYSWSYHILILNARLQNLQCVSNGDTAVLQEVILDKEQMNKVLKKPQFTYNYARDMDDRNERPGARLTKAYDVTIQRCRKSHVKIVDSKMHILRCMGSKFCVKFQRCPLKFHTKFWTHTQQNMHFMRCWKFDDLWYLKSYDILSLSETGPWVPDYNNDGASLVRPPLKWS